MRTVRPTQDVKVQVTSEEKQVNFTRLNDLVSKAGLKTKRMGEPGVTMNIRGMTADTTKDDIVEGIQAVIGEYNGDEYNVSEI